MKLDMDIYKHILETLCQDELDVHKLFESLMVSCDILFKLVETKHGISTGLELPTENLEKIAFFYESKFNEMELNIGMEKYGYLTSYADDKYDKISKEDLAYEIAKKIVREKKNLSFDDTNESDRVQEELDGVKSDLRRISENHLRDFFGYEYNPKDNDERKYEILRLIKILYDCKEMLINRFEDRKIYLEKLKMSSSVKYEVTLSSPYKEAILFIKERVVLRDKFSDYRLPFLMIMELERLVNVIRHRVRTFSKDSLYSVTDYLKSSKLDITKERYAMKIVYESLIDRLKNNKSKQLKKLDNVRAIQSYAYLNFLFMDVRAEFTYNDLIMEKIEMSDKTCSTFVNFVKKESKKLRISDRSYVKKFIEENSEVLLRIIYDDDIFKDGSFQKYKKSLERHLDNFISMYEMAKREILSRIIKRKIYPKSKGEKEDERKFSRENCFILGIYLCEKLAREHISIPLCEGYRSGVKYRGLQISKFLNEIDKRIGKYNEKCNIDEVEYYFGCNWLMDKLVALIEYETSDIRRLKGIVQYEIFECYKTSLPLLSKEDEYFDQNAFINDIFDVTTRKKLLKKIEEF